MTASPIQKICRRTVLLGVLFLWAIAANASADTAGQSKFVGSDTCKGCHEDQFKNIEASPHYRTNLPKIRGEEVHGCESCHGPGAAHVEGGGDKTKIFTFKGAKPDDSH